MRTAAEISRQMRGSIKVLLPDLSMDPLTPERKIADTVAELIADASIDQFVLNYQYDIDTKVGTDLDKFVALFGFARQGGRRATGSVTLSRATAATQEIFIPAGTTVTKPGSSVSGAVNFFTTAPGIIPAGGTSVEVPIEASVEGPLGNVAAATITQLGTSDVTDITNENATSGGSNAESDAELRVRFKNTIFRNVAGTQDQFLALAIASRFAKKASVIGPVSRFVEYVQVEPDLTIASEIPYSKWTYDFDYYVTNGDLANEVFYAPAGVDYSFNDSVPPVITVTNTTNLPVGAVVLFEHTYCSANSRNDPANDIANYVDIYVSGQNGIVATESVSFPASASNFNTTPTSPYDVQRFVRDSSGVMPTVDNRFQELIWQPVMDLPSVLTVNGVDYYEGTDYWFVRDVTAYKGSKRARNGIEWSTGVTSVVTAGTTFSIVYTFDKLPLALNELMDTHKQVTSDVLVHSATERFFMINLIIMYTPGFSRTSVDAAITAALTSFMDRQTFGAMLQLSDILDVVHDVPGVDNVRLATPSDGVAYGVQEVAGDGITIIGAPYTDDFALEDSDLPVLQSIVTTQKSQNTW